MIFPLTQCLDDETAGTLGGTGTEVLSPDCGREGAGEVVVSPGYRGGQERHGVQDHVGTLGLLPRHLTQPAGQSSRALASLPDGRHQQDPVLQLGHGVVQHALLLLLLQAVLRPVVPTKRQALPGQSQAVGEDSIENEGGGEEDSEERDPVVDIKPVVSLGISHVVQDLPHREHHVRPGLGEDRRGEKCPHVLDDGAHKWHLRTRGCHREKRKP